MKHSRSTVLKYLKSQWHFLIYISVTEALSCLLVSKQITFCVCFERSWLEENLWHFFSNLIWTFGCRSKKTESRKCCTWWKNHSKFIYIYISRSYTWVNVYLSRGCRLKKNRFHESIRLKILNTAVESSWETDFASICSLPCAVKETKDEFVRSPDKQQKFRSRAYKRGYGMAHVDWMSSQNIATWLCVLCTWTFQIYCP